jgi:alpha-beta hydrolase superfamily lysophospholipase
MNGEELQLLMPGADGKPPVSIACRFQKPEAGRPVFVWFCGFKSDMGSVKASALAEWARENGAGCLRFDYSGHGKSGGRFEEGTISAWLGQAAAVCAHTLQGTPAVFVGSSMGGWIALLLARQLGQVPPLQVPPPQVPPHPVLLPEGRRDAITLAEDGSRVLSPLGERDRVRGDFTCNLKGIVLIAPAWDMTRLFWDRAAPEARDAILRDGVYYRPSTYCDGPTAITKAMIDDGERHLSGDAPIPLSAPVRILHGCQDPDIPWQRSLTLLSRAGCPDTRLTLIKDGEHRLSRPQDLALLFSTLAEFL